MINIYISVGGGSAEVNLLIFQYYCISVQCNSLVTGQSQTIYQTTDISVKL